MGYCINMIGAKFTIKSENKDKARDAFRKMMSEIQPALSWISDIKELVTTPNLEGIFEEFRYPVKTDDNHNIIGISFDGEKIGSEEVLWEAIAPYVENGSYIEMYGEDGMTWRHTFSSGTYKEVYPTVTWE